MCTELITGPWIDESKRYVCTLRASVLATTFVAFILIFVVPYGSYLLCAIAISCSGLAVGPILPVGFDFSIQLTHPIQPSLVNGML